MTGVVPERMIKMKVAFTCLFYKQRDSSEASHSLLRPLLWINRRGLGLAQHQPVLVVVLGHLLPPVVHGLHLRVAASDVGHAFLSGG